MVGGTLSPTRIDGVRFPGGCVTGLHQAKGQNISWYDPPYSCKYGSIRYQIQIITRYTFSM